MNEKSGKILFFQLHFFIFAQNISESVWACLSDLVPAFLLSFFHSLLYLLCSRRFVWPALCHVNQVDPQRRLCIASMELNSFYLRKGTPTRSKYLHICNPSSLVLAWFTFKSALRCTSLRCTFAVMEEQLFEHHYRWLWLPSSSLTSRGGNKDLLTKRYNFLTLSKIRHSTNNQSRTHLRVHKTRLDHL